jgi:RimJ/RimL family protein N-acetyltransferase
MLVADANICIREVRAGDEAAIERLLTGLDQESRSKRWFSAGVDIRQAGDWAAHPARNHAVGLLAFAGEEPVGHAAVISVGDGRGELAFEVAAPWRHHGIAGALLDQLVELARGSDLHEIYADVLPGNADMLAVLREHGEHTESHHEGIVTLTLPVPRRSAFSGVDEPVRRYLAHALGDERRAPAGLLLTSRGRIRSGAWLWFTAQQDCCGHAFEWRARAGSRRVKPLHVVDRYRDGAGSTDVSLFGRVPLTHAHDENTTRAAAGRAAAESIWMPGTLLPGAGASWRAESDDLIVARFDVAPERDTELHLRIDAAGAVVGVCVMRWGNVGRTGFGYIPFGGDVHAERRFGSLTLPSEITIGWWYGTPRFKPFLRTTIVAATATGQAPSSSP